MGGAVGLVGRPEVRSRGTEVPLVFGVDDDEAPLVLVLDVLDAAPFASGNMEARLCEGAGVGVSAAPAAIGCFWGETAGKGTWVDEDDSDSSPMRRRFPSVFAGDSLIVGAGERMPNDGD